MRLTLPRGRAHLLGGIGIERSAILILILVLLAVVAAMGLQVERLRGVPVFEDDDHVVADAGRGVDAFVEEGELWGFSLWLGLWGGVAIAIATLCVVGGDILF